MKPLCITVIDDDHEVRVALRSALEGWGYAVFSAADGPSGLQLLNEDWPPALLIVDWHMPIMSGRDFISTVRQSPVMAQVPILVISGPENRDEITDVQGFLEKPLRLEDVKRAVETALTPKT